MQKGVNSIEVGFTILDCLGKAKRALSLRELADLTGMTPSKTHSYVVSFVRVGLLAQNPETSHYELGPAALMLGLSAMQRLDVLEASRGHLQKLRDKFKQTVSLSVWGNHGPTVIKWLDGDWPILNDTRAGTVLPVLFSSVGHVFLAYLPRDRTQAFVDQELVAIAGNTTSGKPPDARWIEDVIQDVTARGLARRKATPTGSAQVAEGDAYEPTAAISAPIFRHDGQLAAVVTIVGRSRHLDVSLRGDVARSLSAATSAVSGRLGYVRDMTTETS